MKEEEFLVGEGGTDSTSASNAEPEVEQVDE
jgi:hypothetical protein